MSTSPSVLSTGLSTSGAPTLGNATSGGIDVATAVANQMQVYNQPLTLLQTQQTTLNAQVSVLSSISTDLSSLQTAVEDLNSTTGSLNAKNTNSTDSAIVTALAGSAATPGSHTVVVNNLATTSAFYSTELPPATTTFTPGSLTFHVGTGSDVSVSVDSTDNTLQGLASAINGKNAGVTASVVTDTLGSRLSLVSNTSGAGGDVSVTANSTGLGLTKSVTGIDASISADGIPVTSASNVFTNAIAGVTLNLQGADPTRSISVSVTADPNQATTAINTFIAAYNKVAADINAQNATGSGSSALLTGDSTLHDLQQRILTDVSTSLSGNGSAVNLESIGIQLQDDGTLNLNAATLKNALNTNFTGVQNLFQNAAGVGATFDSDITNMTDPVSGSISLAVKGDNNTLQSLQDSINDMQAQLSDKQTALETYYNNVNVTLEEMPILLQQTNAQLGKSS